MMMSSEKKKYRCHQNIMTNVVKLTIGLGLIFIVCISRYHLNLPINGTNISRYSDHTPPKQWIKGLKSDEHRIAQQFDADTLPGLMRSGLIKKYARHQTGTILFVSGKVWKERSRFFKESLLLASLVYNKVNGYPLETRIVDCCSQQLYAHAVSADRKEFFD
jgi:hypothetical protein